MVRLRPSNFRVICPSVSRRPCQYRRASVSSSAQILRRVGCSFFMFTRCVLRIGRDWDKLPTVIDHDRAADIINNCHV